MKIPNISPLFLWISIGFLLVLLLLYLWISHTNRITYQTETFSESNQYIANPYQGFYHIIRYMLSDNTPTEDVSNQAASYTAPLVLLEINLRNYRNIEISETGLEQLQNILTAWSQSPSNTKLILRFLYDWDGIALATEPASFQLILKHMDQISAPVNQHRDAVYIMQGIFIGSWGEMHHSNYMDDISIQMLTQHLHDIIDPSIYLSVRTPAQWRMILNRYHLPARFPAFGVDNSLTGRLGLFNDGILGSESDLGTYGNTARYKAASPGYQGTRKEELAFQNQLCRYVPNGGEAIYHNSLSNLKTSVSALRTMHISYLNADHDSRILEKWKSTIWTGKDAFYGIDGYSYIQAHLGYRYLIHSCKIKRSGWIRSKCTLALTIQNDGFGNALKPFHTSVTLVNSENGESVSIPIQTDLRTLLSGCKKIFTVHLPVKTLGRGNYQIYFSITDKTSGQKILLGNQNEITDNGYLLGRLEK